MAKKTEQKASKQNAWTDPARGRKQCPRCHKYVSSAVSQCPACGNDFPRKPRKPRGKNAAQPVDPAGALEEQLKAIDAIGGPEQVGTLIRQAEDARDRLEPLGGIEKAKATLATLEKLALFFQTKQARRKTGTD